MSYFSFQRPIAFRGEGFKPSSGEPFAYRYYDKDRVVLGKRMEDQLRFAVCYWHSFVGSGLDPFGDASFTRPWHGAGDPMQQALHKADVAFDLFSTVDAPFFTFHDRDVAPEGATLRESNRNLRHVAEVFERKISETGVRLLWGTANLFSHPRYMNGASTNPDFAVVARAAVQVKAALEATVELGGEHYVFWGGREGYAALANTQMKREVDHLARFLTMARDHGRSIGLKGNFLIEPKPMEPMKHQYDFDSATVVGFLKEHGLDKDFKLNIEANHATLSGHTFEHDLQVASDHGLLGSIDANRGNAQNGWDTDQFPTDLYDTVGAMLVVLRQGGLEGGLNFDAKVRRESTDLEDLFIAHVGGMDAFARGLEVAHALLNDSPLEQWRKERYASFDSGAGKDFAGGALSLAELAALGAKGGEPRQISGKQERYENLINQYLLR
jgi:xylose isomerase